MIEFALTSEIMQKVPLISRTMLEPSLISGTMLKPSWICGILLESALTYEIMQEFSFNSGTLFKPSLISGRMLEPSLIYGTDFSSYGIGTTLEQSLICRICRCLTPVQGLCQATHQWAGRGGISPFVFFLVSTTLVAMISHAYPDST